jgi:hypothetical protein
VTLAVSTVAALLVVAASWRYFSKVRRKDPDADPRLASWAIWTSMPTVGALGAAADRQWPGACLTAADAACCAAILACGWRHGNREFGRLDAACTTLGAAGVGLLAAAAVAPRLIPVYAAVAVSVATDLTACAPTFANGWRGKEPWPSFAIFAGSGAVTLTVCDFAVPAGVIFPAYLAAANTVLTLIILASPARRSARSAWRADGEPLALVRRAGPGPPMAGHLRRMV